MLKINELAKLNIDVTDALKERIDAFSARFLEYNAHTNLISKNDEKLLFEKHIYDSLAINLVEEVKSAKRILDIGTGGGFPATPTAMLFPESEVVGVDSVNKKINFINSVAQNMGLGNLKGVCSRTEELPKEYRESFDIVTSRAVATLNIILEYAMPYLKVGGVFVAFKSQLSDTEILEAQKAFKELNCEVSRIVSYKLPLEENFARKLIIIKKTGKTPSKFPRKAGVAKSNPIV